MSSRLYASLAVLALIGAFPCDIPLQLYCLSNATPALLFADGFESGGTRLWNGP